MILLRLYQHFFDFIAETRIAKADLDLRRIHFHTAIVLTTSVLMWAYAATAYFTSSSATHALIAIICSAVHLLSPFLFRFTNNAFFISNLMLAAGIAHQGSFSYFTGGFGSVTIIWFGILPMLAGLIAGKKATIFWFITTTIIAAIFLILDQSGYPFPNTVSPLGHLIARGLIIFGWIFLSTSITYVVLVINDSKESLLTDQAQKIDALFRVLFHDLAGPLNRISMGLKLSMRETDPSRKEQGLLIATKATDAMLDITQNVRKMYALSKGKNDVSSDLCYCPLNESIEYIKKLYAGELEKKNIKLIYDSQKYKDLKVLVEPISFNNQVLGNAISNSIKFSHPGSTITIRVYPRDQHFFAVEICDQGIGMPPLLMESLFDINKKTSRTGTNGESGTGFGMHIMKSFIEMYQGKVEVESKDETQPMPGTIIKFLLKAEIT
jgi:signal transduction histidine kinase